MTSIYLVCSGVELSIKKEKIMFLYLGPGLGGGIIAVITGIFLTIFAFIVAIFWVPIKKFLGLFKKNKKQEV